MRKYIIPGVGVIFCGILIYQTYSLNTIKGELENIKSANMTLQEEVSSLSSELSSQIESTLYEGNDTSWLDSNKKKLIKYINEEFDMNQVEDIIIK